MATNMSTSPTLSRKDIHETYMGVPNVDVAQVLNSAQAIYERVPDVDIATLMRAHAATRIRSVLTSGRDI